MKITKTQLKQIIKEELEASMMKETEGGSLQDPKAIAKRINGMPDQLRIRTITMFSDMADGKETTLDKKYSNIADLPAFALEVLIQTAMNR